MNYKCLQNNTFHFNSFSIKPIDSSEIEQIRIWRNAQMNVLRQKQSISVEQQIIYFERFIWPLFEKSEPHQILFSFYKNDKFLGYGGLVHISWADRRAEMSFLVNPSYTKCDISYEKFLSSFISLIKKVVYDELNFHKLYTETYANRTFHISVLEKNGFVLEGVLRDHVIINEKFTNSLIHSILNYV